MPVRGLDKGEAVALVIGECQRGATNPTFRRGELALQAEARGIIQKIAGLADVCRKHGIPVIHATKIGRADGGGTFVNSPYAAISYKGRLGPEREESTAIHPALAPQEKDYVVARLHGFSCFHGTELESILRTLGVQTIILVGVSTNLNLPGTSLEAVNRGFTVVLPEDCTAGTTPEIHNFQIENFIRLMATVTTLGEVHQALLARGSRS